MAAYSGNQQIFGQNRRGHPAHCRMVTSLVKEYAPGLDFVQCILQRHEPVIIQAFLTQPAVEGLDCSVVRGCSRA